MASRRAGDVVCVSRTNNGLDVTDPTSVEDILGKLGGPFDTIVIATGVLGTPEKSVAQIDAAEMARLMAVNAIGPSLVLRHVPRLLAKTGRVAVLSARVGSIGDNQIGGWHSYRASKAALNQIVRGAAIELKRSHRAATCVALHPGTVETPFTAEYLGRHSMVAADEAALNLWRVIDGLGPEQSGGFFDYSGKVVPW